MYTFVLENNKVQRRMRHSFFLQRAHKLVKIDIINYTVI